MDRELADKIVVVTGASKGIGYACAEAFAREDARVVLVSRNAANLDAALAHFPKTRHATHTVVADLVPAKRAPRMADEIERKVGPIDILVSQGACNKASAPKRP